MYRPPDPLQQVHVALDLETTGLDSNRDAIIEIGAVKFQGDEDIDTFQTFIKPDRPIPDFVQRLTGISPDQVSRAPLFSSVSRDLQDFIGSSPVIGHNVSFDLRFLDSHDLALANTSYDTWDLASILLPRTTQYSLGFLASHFGVVHDRAHRALDDAKATQHIFLALLREAAALDPGLLAHLANLAQRSNWSIAPLLLGLERAGNGPEATPTVFGLTGLDLESIGSRLGRVEKRRAEPTLASLDEDKISGLLSSDGPFSKAFEGFEYRPEQEQMLAAVTKAIYQGQHLVVEGGTGVGKSMAYLLPAALFAVSQGQRVVISTNTINLQEQLMSKDIPAMIHVLEEAGLVSRGVIKAAQLKGRTNYLCLRRWNFLASAESPSVDDARLLGKTSVWLQDTVNGDRGEINLSGRDAFTWSRISAGEGGWCPGLRDGSACFLRTARERAEQAHIIVVNHALLMSDLARGGSLIPEYQHLIIDEAHNLEDAATRQLGFKVGPDSLDDTLESHGRLITQLRLAMGAEGMASPVRQEAEKVVGEVEGAAPRLREVWARLWTSAERFFGEDRKGRGDGQDTGQSLLLTQAGSPSGGSRDGQKWAELALDWENAGAVLQQTVQGLDRMGRFLQTDPFSAATDGPALAMEAGNIQDNLEQVRVQLDSIL
ncbi:MAG: 3'-5' exoribonuclease, partial [Chloroflexi bacterium]|nr:3'-5' exoribonuclease [Chloroflexota bacterium]